MQSFRVTALRELSHRESEKVFLDVLSWQYARQSHKERTDGSESLHRLYRAGCNDTDANRSCVHVRGVFCDSHGKLTGGWDWVLCALWGCLGVGTRCLQKQRTAAVTRPPMLSIRKTRAMANQVVCMPRIVDASESKITGKKKKNNQLISLGKSGLSLKQDTL